MFSDQSFKSALVAVLALGYPPWAIIRRDHALILTSMTIPGEESFVRFGAGRLASQPYS